MNWLRPLIPSWKFFDTIGDFSSLQYRICRPKQTYTQWTEAISLPKRRWQHVFFNPEGNAYLAKHALIDQLLYEIQHTNTEAIPQTTSYQLIENLIKGYIRQHYPSTAEEIYFQFRIYITPSSNENPFVAIISGEKTI